MVVSLHPYSEGTRSNPAYFAPGAGNSCAALHTGFLGVAAEAALRQHVPAIVNMHAAAAPAGHPRGEPAGAIGAFLPMGARMVWKERAGRAAR